MVLIESMPYYDQGIHSVPEIMPSELGSQKTDSGLDTCRDELEFCYN